MTGRAKNWAISGGIGLAALVFGGWWLLHDPLRGLRGHMISDNTTFYKADGRIYLTPRRVRTVMFKDLSVPTLLSSIQSKYPGTEGWKWNMRGMPNNVGAVRRLAGRDDPEHVSATITSEGTLEFVEERAMSPAEVQMIIRSQGSDAFVLNPLAPSPHRRMENPRLAFGG